MALQKIKFHCENDLHVRIRKRNRRSKENTTKEATRLKLRKLGYRVPYVKRYNNTNVNLQDFLLGNIYFINKGHRVIQSSQ